MVRHASFGHPRLYTVQTAGDEDVIKCHEWHCRRHRPAGWPRMHQVLASGALDAMAAWRLEGRELRYRHAQNPAESPGWWRQVHICQPMARGRFLTGSCRQSRTPTAWSWPPAC